MDQPTRLAARFMVKVRMADLYGNAFEDFFHELMCLRYSDFMDVRTAGTLGDLGSDGLSLVGRKLYSCYGPQTVDAYEIEKKIEKDIKKAREKRPGEFETYVFVHSDQRGMHPVVASKLALIAADETELRFEVFGLRKFQAEVVRLEQAEVEDLIGQALPIQELRYGVELEDVVVLLEHLQRSGQAQRPDEEILAVSAQKLDFNEFSDETRDELRRNIIRCHIIDLYYEDRYLVTERDEVAAAFREEFDRVRVAGPTAHPDEILHQMEMFLLGNLSPSFTLRRAAMLVLAYFFQSCDIFEDSPIGWTAATRLGGDA